MLRSIVFSGVQRRRQFLCRRVLSPVCFDDLQLRVSDEVIVYKHNPTKYGFQIWARALVIFSVESVRIGALVLGWLSWQLYFFWLGSNGGLRITLVSLTLVSLTSVIGFSRLRYSGDDTQRTGIRGNEVNPILCFGFIIG
ncbi:hypothetical protein F2Q70_00000657 [Brassica cretica]|uniref:Uncharacterized protein n=1 Tax=Brassica cretica TaxID=69181 RepID=A0A8S9IP58_BRACR|nr:hypothetical protein F2Q70_00000657 [Brassica cretica]